MKTPLALIILDGFGERSQSEFNAIKLAKTPHLNSFYQNYPHTLIDASGTSVGLPGRLMGNSEVGHLTLGAGRIVLLGLTRIYSAIADDSFFANPALLQAMQAVKENGRALHLMGLVSDGAVHSHQDHLYALLEMAKRQDLTQVFIHVFTDGRDTAPQAALGYIDALEAKIKEIGIGQIATVSGRYYAMDRDQRWERTQLAYDAIVDAKSDYSIESARKAIEESYAIGENDEFIKPTVILDQKGFPIAKMGDGDAIIFFNFRADRARQLTRALTQKQFEGFQRNRLPHLSQFTCFAEYDANFHLPVAFPKIDIVDTFPQILSDRGLKQLRIAETEKYAHVTFFFSGGVEKEYPGEDRVLIPSPKEVATYDLKPEMSAYAITTELLKRIESDQYDFILCNYANPDMVGHTGDLKAAIRAVEVVDECLGQVVQAILKKQGIAVITADHGNCEQMADAAGTPHTAHTSEWVPFLVIGEKWKKTTLREGGGLPDVAPTLLQILGLKIPSVMDGRSLLL